MKVFCYGVRRVERPLFEEINEQFHYDLVLTARYLDTEESARLAKGCDAVLLRGNCKANRQNLQVFKELGIPYLLTRSVGTDHIDLKAAHELGFQMARTPAASPYAVAELAVSMAFALHRRLPYIVSRTHMGQFETDPDMFNNEVNSSTIGIIGIGRIGQIVARVFSSLSARVLAHDPYPPKGVEEFCELVDKEYLIRNSDIISLHCPYIASQGKVLGEKEFEMMKKTAIVINCARGELVDTEALYRAISTDQIYGAGLDTLENESKFFFKMPEEYDENMTVIQGVKNLYPRVISTPHLGSYAVKATKQTIEASFENLQKMSSGAVCENAI